MTIKCINCELMMALTRPIQCADGPRCPECAEAYIEDLERELERAEREYK